MEAVERGTLTHIDRPTIRAVYASIRLYLRTTPVVTVPGSDLGSAASAITFKLESLQVSGSFKARGAFANLTMRPLPHVGVVAASGGNHGAAVAYAAARLGVPAKIFVPRTSPALKAERIRAYGADLELVGDSYAQALAASEAWADAHGALRVPAYDQLETIAGQGTLALEMEQQVAIDTVLVAVGGGGLLAGTVTYYEDRIKVIGVEPAAAPTLTKALEAGHPVDAPGGGIAADSLAPLRVGDRVFPIVRARVNHVLLVSDDTIRRAQRHLWEALRVIAEPGGATPLAALLQGAYVPRAGERVGVVISGGNTGDLSFIT